MFFTHTETEMSPQMEVKGSDRLITDKLFYYSPGSALHCTETQNKSHGLNRMRVVRKRLDPAAGKVFSPRYKKIQNCFYYRTDAGLPLREISFPLTSPLVSTFQHHKPADVRPLSS